MTAQDAFYNWLLAAGLLIAIVVVAAFCIVLVAVVLSMSRRKDES
jgi:hypothetical protein